MRDEEGQTQAGCGEKGTPAAGVLLPAAAFTIGVSLYTASHAFKAIAFMKALHPPGNQRPQHGRRRRRRRPQS